jgi:WD40 repeat protein
MLRYSPNTVQLLSQTVFGVAYKALHTTLLETPSQVRGGVPALVDRSQSYAILALGTSRERRMSRLFISHSSVNNAAAVALGRWLSEQGFDDVFLDIDPDRGLAPGERWQEALKAAADRCEAVLFLVSPAWLASKWCLAEFLLAKSLHKRIFGLIIEPVPFDRIPSEMTAEWQLCELVGEDRFRGFDVEVLGKAERIEFREAGLDLLRRGLQRAGLDAKSFPWPPRDEPDRAPYRGLKALEPQDAAIFFGRDAWIVRGLDRIRGLTESGIEKLLVILGASGSGKSSFLRAGLWPRLLRDDANFLPLPVIRPQTAAISGSNGLAVALAGAFERLGEPRPPGRIKVMLGGVDAFGHLLDELVGLAKRRLVAIKEEETQPTIVLSLDQAEELFNPDGADEAVAFLGILAGMLVPVGGTPARRVLVVATMRSDRYELLQAEPRLEAVRQDLFYLPPIPLAEFKGVIEGPTHRIVEAGGRLEIAPALTERLIADAQGADALPLLGFTLERLYADYGSAGHLTLADYGQMGGVQGSIEAAVAAALAEPGRVPSIPGDREAQLVALRAAFIPWLARIDPERGVPMRRVARREEIPSASRSIVERLVEARLLVTDRRDGIDIVEIAHESLLRQWQTLTDWLVDAAHELQLIEGVERAASQWNDNTRAEIWLDHRSDRLREAEHLVAQETFRQRVGETGLTYLIACRGREDAERREKEKALAREEARLAEMALAQARTARMQRVRTWALATIGVVVAVGVGAVSWQQLRLTAGQRALDQGRNDILAGLAAVERLRGNLDGALRLAVWGTRLELDLSRISAKSSLPGAELAGAAWQSIWRTVLSGHKSSVLSAGFTADGHRIVTASADKTARIWDAATGAEIAVLRGHADRVLFAAFNLDGTRIVTASADKTAWIWDAASGAEIAILRGHEDAVASASFSPDGKRIVTSSWDGTARIWDAETGAEIAALRGHADRVVFAAFNLDGTRIVTASWDQTARIWDAVTGAEVAVLRGHEEAVASASFSPDGKRIVTASWDRTARIWDAATGAEIAALRGHENRLNSAAFNRDGKWLVTASDDMTARIWDASTAKEIMILRGHESIVTFATFSPEGSSIATASADRTAREWSLTREIAVLEGHQGTVNSALYSSDGAQIVTASNDNTARIWDVATGRPLKDLRGHSDHVLSAAFSSDGTRVVTASWDQTARIWDAAAGTEIAVLRGHQDAVYSAVFSPDGSRIVTASLDKTARIWDAATGNEIAVLRGHENYLTSAAFSPDGMQIVTASADKTARIWDAATGREIAVLRHGGSVADAAYSLDGARVVTVSGDKTAKIWNAVTATEITTLRGHDGPLVSGVFSPDGTRVATASADGTARIWDVATGREIAMVSVRGSLINSAAFSPDSTRVVTASDDNAARVWDVSLVTMAASDVIGEVCKWQLHGLAELTRDEMRLAGYSDAKHNIDVCAPGSLVDP